MIIRKITKYLFEDGTDIEFAPSDQPGVYEVWINGVRIADTERGRRPSELLAQYYYEVHGLDLPELLGVDVDTDNTATAVMAMH